MTRAIGLHRVRVSPANHSILICGAPQQRARVIDALKGRANVHVVDDLSALRGRLSTTAITWDTLVFAVDVPVPARLAGLIQSIATDWPELAIVACCKPASPQSNDIRSLALAGVHQFIFAEVEDSGIALRGIVSSARTLCAAEWVLRHLAEAVPIRLHPLVEAVLRRPAEILTVEALAAALGVHRRTIFNRCEREHFIAPAELITWVRLALVAYLLARTSVTVESIALELNFPSDTALRNAIKRYTGFRALELRANGGLECVVRALQRRSTALMHAV